MWTWSLAVLHVRDLALWERETPRTSRNTLFKEFVRVVRVTQPKVVLFENVTGIFAKKNENTLKTIFKSFEKLGYTMDAKVLSSDDYKVPSRRRRTIIMGVKGGLPLFPQLPPEAKKSMSRTHSRN